MKQLINIMYIIDHFHVAGGTETHLTHLVTGLDRTRFKPVLIVFDFKDNTLAEKIKAVDIPIIHIPVGRFYGFDAIRKAFRLAKFIRQYKPDIVQTFHIKSDTYGALIARICGVKHIISSNQRSICI
jgi:hypothetical protein